MSEGFRERFIQAAGDGTALTNSTTPASILPGAAIWTLPSGFFNRLGAELILRASGRISTNPTTPGTFKFEVKLGSITVFDGGAMTLNTTQQTNVNWWLEVILACRSIGKSTAATLLGQGWFKSHAVIGSPAPSAGGAGCHMLPYNAAAAAGSGFDSTAAQAVDLYGTWSVANANNSIQVHQYSLEGNS